MKNKKNTMIYPFDQGAVSLVRYNNMVEEHKFVKVVSPNGWGFVGKDVSSVDLGSNMGIKVDGDFEKGLENVDTVLFIKPDKEISFDKVIYPKIKMAAENSKNITIDFNLDDEKIKELENLCKSHGIEFKLLNKKVNKLNTSKEEKIYDIGVPVVFVLGLGERTSKFDIQLKLRNDFTKKGYSVSQVGTKSYSELFGFHSFPQFMYNSNILESQKVVMFNYYIKKIEKEEKPDVIIIGIPGGTMPFNNKLTNRFGILAFEVSQAIVPDVAVLSIFNDDLEESFCELLSNSYKYKFGYNIDCFNAANTSLDFAASESRGFAQHVTVDSDFVDTRVKSTQVGDHNIYNIFNEKDVNDMANFLIDKLLDYGESKIV